MVRLALTNGLIVSNSVQTPKPQEISRGFMLLACLIVAPTGGSRARRRMSATEGKPEGRPTPGGGYFVFRNSFDPRSGHDGYGFLSFEYMRNYSNDAIVIQPGD
jgi:hypothetical protein